MALVGDIASGGRWLGGASLARFALPLLALPGGVAAAPSHCEQVPPGERGLCRMVLSCSVIEDAERREQCFRAAADAAEDDAAVEEAAVEGPSTIAAPVDAVPRPTEAPARQATTPPAPAPSNAVARKVVERTVLDIPDRFTAAVEAVHSLVRNRQLLVLQGDLLFETDRAEQSRIDVGDEVNVVRTSALFGRRYRISAPARAAVSATRLRCERLDLGTDTRRKCALIERDGSRRD